MTDLERAILHIKTRADAWAVKEIEKALSQEPCDDAVSRDAVIEICNEEWDSDLLVERIEHLPSVTQKSEKWIKIQSGDKDFPESIVCSKCGSENSHLDFNENAEPIGKVFVTSKYCPNCGAKMESEEQIE